MDWNMWARDVLVAAVMAHEKAETQRPISDEERVLATLIVGAVHRCGHVRYLGTFSGKGGGPLKYVVAVVGGPDVEEFRGFMEAWFATRRDGRQESRWVAVQPESSPPVAPEPVDPGLMKPEES